MWLSRNRQTIRAAWNHSGRCLSDESDGSENSQAGTHVAMGIIAHTARVSRLGQIAARAHAGSFGRPTTAGKARPTRRIRVSILAFTGP